MDMVGGIPTPLKNMSSSVGMMKNKQLNGKINKMFQTTKQFLIGYKDCFRKQLQEKFLHMT